MTRLFRSPWLIFKGRALTKPKILKMEPFWIWPKFCIWTNLSARNPFKIVPMADFQGKISHGAKNPKIGAILDFAKILHLD